MKKKNNLQRAKDINLTLLQLYNQCNKVKDKRRFVQLVLEFSASLTSTFSIDFTEDLLLYTQLLDKNCLERDFDKVRVLLKTLYNKLKGKER